jgi:hypothetical protein
MRGGIGIMHELRRKERSTTGLDIRKAPNYTFPASSQPSNSTPRCGANFFYALTIADNSVARYEESAIGRGSSYRMLQRHIVACSCPSADYCVACILLPSEPGNTIPFAAIP